MDAKRGRAGSFFGLPRAGARALTRARWALRRRRLQRGSDVEERMRKVEAELEEARRLDGSDAPP
jgi:hypothetical protein